MSEQVRDGTFVGALHADRRLGGLTLAETSYRAGLVVPAHAHESALVTLVVDGALTEERGHRRALCETGSLIFHPSAEPHGHSFSRAGGRCFVVQFGPSWVERMRAFGVTEPRTPADLRRSRANWLAAQLYGEFRTADTASELAIEGFALALVGELARAGSGAETKARPPWLIRAVDILHANLAATPSLTELAAAVGIHPAHLSRTFHEQFGCTMSEYLRRRRVELAQRELVGTGRSLADIAYAAGFADQAHFSRVFKQITGVSPGAYRKAAAGR
jgi:AraC family transcriptional regulator